MKAVWNNVVIAESDETILIENNHYFPSNSILKEYFTLSNTNTVCSWKGKASYYNIEVNGSINEDSAWFYPDPKNAAIEIKNYIAFWKGVKIYD